jgi:hypothetical protein
MAPKALTDKRLKRGCELALQKINELVLANAPLVENEVRIVRKEIYQRRSLFIRRRCFFTAGGAPVR